MLAARLGGARLERPERCLFVRRDRLAGLSEYECVLDAEVRPDTEETWRSTER